MAGGDGMRGNPNTLEEKNVLEFYTNEKVVVSLTKDGEVQLKNYWMNIYRNYDYKNKGYSSLEEYVEKEIIPLYYKDGYYKDQLWMIMKIFGEGCQDDHLASPFEGCKIYFRGGIGGAEMVKGEDMRENSGKLEDHALEFNVNEKVVASLTKDGEVYLKNYWMNIYRNYDYKNKGYSSLEEYVEEEVIPLYYKDGYYTDQFWIFMEIFGEHMASGESFFKEGKIYFREGICGVQKVSDEMNGRLLDVLS